MGGSCPSCGAPAEFAPQGAVVLQGTCPECGGQFTVVRNTSTVTGGAPDSSQPSPPARVASGAGWIPPTPKTGSGPGPVCAVCGSSLVLRSWSETAVEAACSACSATVMYRSIPIPEESGARTSRGHTSRDRDLAFGPSSGRPCRECGGPLRFSTDADGSLVGECPKCGNRFTLPPRRESGRRPEGFRGRPRRFGGGVPERYSSRGRPPRGRSQGGFRSARSPPGDGEERGPEREDVPTEERRRRRPRRY